MKDTPYFDPGLLDESKAYYNVMPEKEIVVETPDLEEPETH